ncbi:integrase [Geoalkalibacter ferrihydriticus]|uniref:Integrase n=2 Tax=Geoalkalibacter ferrihydriticus TaxID=392333 RepID=A0A1G9X1Y3_9BACT|nr:tyrosine-type recombinase/integrase [Geoalkalibacter ferrihydriticus]SDM90375.1 integrase [Geoalkalibacter ferrihydriticus]
MDKITEGTFVFSKAFPNASTEEKAHFAKLEGWDYQPGPRQVLFGDYARRWMQRIWASWPEGTKKDDYRKDLKPILAHFEEMTFYQISLSELQIFVGGLKHQRGSKKGKQLSRQRIKNIILPFRAIWEAAVDEYRWILSNPFANPRKYLPNTKGQRRQGFRYDEWMRFFEHLDPWFQPIAELMALTGLIASELAGLRRSDIVDGHIRVKTTIVRGRKKGCKTSFRERKIPITQAIQKRLDDLLARDSSEHFVKGKKGGVFRASALSGRPWTKAAKKSGVTGKVPYCLRHSFAAWALALRIDPNRLVSLMGHGSKKMVYEVYGSYIEGINQDVPKILAYFGEDFLQADHSAMNSLASVSNEVRYWFGVLQEEAGHSAHPPLVGESLGESDT